MGALRIVKCVPAVHLVLLAKQDIMELLVSMIAHRVMVTFATGAMDSAHTYVQTINFSTHLK